MSKCERCHKKTNVTTMSFLNSQMICLPCEEEERKHPQYKEARAAERIEVKKGNYNYRGLLD